MIAVLEENGETYRLEELYPEGWKILKTNLSFAEAQELIEKEAGVRLTIQEIRRRLKK